MSRFYISGKNERNSNFKKGGRSSLVSHIRGWNKGLLITASVNAEGLDQFEIFTTDGTNGLNNPAKLIKTIVDKKSAGKRNPKGQLK